MALCGPHLYPNYRHIHPDELALLNGMPPGYQWDSPKMALCALGQLASALQAAWLGSHIMQHVSRFFDLPPVDSPESMLLQYMETLLTHRDEVFGLASKVSTKVFQQMVKDRTFVMPNPMSLVHDHNKQPGQEVTGHTSMQQCQPTDVPGAVGTNQGTPTPRSSDFHVPSIASDQSEVEPLAAVASDPGVQVVCSSPAPGRSFAAEHPVPTQIDVDEAECVEPGPTEIPCSRVKPGDSMTHLPDPARAVCANTPRMVATPGHHNATVLPTPPLAGPCMPRLGDMQTPGMTATPGYQNADKEIAPDDCIRGQHLPAVPQANLPKQPSWESQHTCRADDASNCKAVRPTANHDHAQPTKPSTAIAPDQRPLQAASKEDHFQLKSVLPPPGIVATPGFQNATDDSHTFHAGPVKSLTESLTTPGIAATPGYHNAVAAEPGHGATFHASLCNADDHSSTQQPGQAQA